MVREENQQIRIKLRTKIRHPHIFIWKVLHREQMRISQNCADSWLASTWKLTESHSTASSQHSHLRLRVLCCRTPPHPRGCPHSSPWCGRRCTRKDERKRARWRSAVRSWKWQTRGRPPRNPQQPWAQTVRNKQTPIFSARARIRIIRSTITLQN